MPRLRSDSYEAPSTGRLDRVPTRTRLARQGISTTGKSPTRTTPGRTARPTLFTNSKTKVRAFNATTYYFLLSWLQQLPTWKQYRCQILLFTAHPGMRGENLSLYAPYRVLFCHRSPSREDTTRTVLHDLGDSALSTCPRPVLDLASTYHRSAGRKGRRGTGLRVFSPSRPLRHHGVQGWSVISGARRYSLFHWDRQNFTSKAPWHPCLLYPIKGHAGALRGKGGRRTTNHGQRKLNLLLYSHFSFETWARFLLSQLITPTQTLRCKEIQYSPSPLDVGPSFVRTRINLRVSSLHHHPD
jgi:hypothetical protein